MRLKAKFVMNLTDRKSSLNPFSLFAVFPKFTFIHPKKYDFLILDCSRYGFLHR